MSSVTFGAGNQGFQVGQSNAPIQASFHLPAEPLEAVPQPFASIPFARDRAFVDRGDILSQIDNECLEPAGRVALVGLGGVGKSQLAIEFAYRFADRSPKTWVFWIHASTQARIFEGFKTIADTVKLKDRNQPQADILQLVFKWLSNQQNGKWLVVLDSADEYDVLYGTSGKQTDGRLLATYLPQSQNGSIILTTRNKDLAFRLTGAYKRIKEIGPMTQKEAMLLLENRLGPLSDAIVAADLVSALDLIPLAISQAAGYIQMRAPRTSLAQYLAEFRQSESKRVRLLSYDAGDLRRDLRLDGGASNAILTTWQVSFDHIRSKRPSAADLLSFMSFFDCQGIPEWILRPTKACNDAAQTRGVEDNDDSEFLGSDGEAEDDFEDDIAALRDYCLIIVNTAANTFEMHGLLQLSTRRWLKAHGLRERFQEQYITVMASSFPNGEYKNWVVCQTLFAHVEAAAQCQPEEDSLKEAWSSLLYKGGWYAWRQGRYIIAERMLFKARITQEKLLGLNHMSSVASRSLLASIHREQGRWEEAEKLFVQVIETYKAKLGVDHPNTLNSIANLATIFRRQGRLEEAEKLFGQVIETHKAKLGVDHPNTLNSIANLAAIFGERGRLEEAEKLFGQVTETFKVKLGVDHPNTLTSMSSLVLTLWSQGRLEEAEKLGVQVMETLKTKLGVDHPDTLISMANLAYTWHSLKKTSKAIELMGECVRLQQLKLGLNNPATQFSISTLREWQNMI